MHKLNSKSLVFSFDSKFITPPGILHIEKRSQYGAKLQEFASAITITELPDSKICISRRINISSVFSLRMMTPLGIRSCITSNLSFSEQSNDILPGTNLVNGRYNLDTMSSNNLLKRKIKQILEKLSRIKKHKYNE